MKRFLGSLCLIVFAVGLIMAINVPLVAGAAKDQLVVYNWADYIDLDVLDEFEAEYDVEITYSIFDTNEIMLGTIMNDKNTSIDLICPSDYAIERMLNNSLIDEIDTSKLTNYSNVNASIITKVDDTFEDLTDSGANKKMSSYFVPYFYGTVGVLYNKKHVDKSVAEEAGYGLLWNTPNIEALNGKILMKDSIREAYLAGLLYLKENDKLPEKYESMPLSKLINTLDDELIELVETVFKDQKRLLKEYEVDTGKNYMENEEAYVSLAWSGDALYAMEQNENLDYYVPSIGGNIWFDGWVIPKNAKNKDMALKFIDFMLRPDIAMKNAMAVGYTSAVKEEAVRVSEDAITVLEENEFDVDEFFADTIRYPDLDNANLVLMRDFPDDSALLAMWERVKATRDYTWLWILIGSLAGAALIGLAIFFIIKNKKKRQVVEPESN
ncbi:MAG: ABC transporter substrate-binding protein [Christensenellaceae bacterium]|jgi:spermidine/putrescine transport system substrate-binding protein|nr:ABC transporter substrate-binding protein [Christensenellaceae bacterium]